MCRVGGPKGNNGVLSVSHCVNALSRTGAFQSDVESSNSGTAGDRDEIVPSSRLLTSAWQMCRNSWTTRGLRGLTFSMEDDAAGNGRLHLRGSRERHQEQDKQQQQALESVRREIWTSGGLKLANLVTPTWRHSTSVNAKRTKLYGTHKKRKISFSNSAWSSQSDNNKVVNVYENYRQKMSSSRARNAIDSRHYSSTHVT
ncbi:unnamed protein product [Nesidiocoris tenuis]|uniref:Uncharacterized protein n=1 Tax=Nesidiocoris tenuis TaxID=355587 RepID=A0A6H5H105_9HEMI|nr:unnamed protein product [Nesidiocoris tenuis]